jgi:hypothetical protein
MDIQPITYQGRTLAACTPQRVFLSDELEARGPSDPLTRFVVEMCLYAGLILNGLLSEPYCDDDARAFARRMLVPAELYERPGPREHVYSDLHRVADALGLPARELRVQLQATAVRC